MKKNVQKRKQKREKNTWGKLQCFKEKDKKTKISTILIVKKRIKKNNSVKNKKKENM